MRKVIAKRNAYDENKKCHSRQDKSETTVKVVFVGLGYNT